MNTAQLPAQQTRRRSHEQHQLYSNVEFGKSVRDTFRLKKRKKKTADSDTYGAVDFDNALNNNESRSISSSKQYHQSKSLKPFGGKLGLGHNFQLISLTNPSWCDHCGEFIWGLNKQCIKCSSECVCVYLVLPYLSILKPGSNTRRGSNIRRVVQQNERNKRPGPF